MAKSVKCPKCGEAAPASSAQVRGPRMTFDQLCEFIEKKMRMGHIYQPLLIKSLLDSGGIATIRQLALSFLSQDESQLLNYEKRIAKMPVRVLERHDIIGKDGQLVSLNVGKLSFTEKAHIKAMCDRKIHEFLEKRGLATWNYSLLESDPVPDTVRYEVLRRAGGKCELCGISGKERALHVDHIIPRSKKGKNDPDNLQALCAKDNLGKGNRDATDWRRNAEEKIDGCTFCTDDKDDRIIEVNQSVFAIRDGCPVTDWHCLIIPFRHVADFFAMSDAERQQANQLARYMAKRIRRDDDRVTGFNVGYNCGDAAGQTVMHAHMHLIPRRTGDVKEPRGGIRGAVPGKMSY